MAGDDIVAVVYDFVTRDVISVTTNTTGPPLLESGQECIIVSMEYYNRFPDEASFLDAVMSGG